MPVSFVDLAQTCAPTVSVETLAGVVSLESQFEPFAIRINSGPPLPGKPGTKAEAIEVATSLVAERHDVQLGLGGIGLPELQKLQLSISDAFDPCLNLRATATLLNRYYRLAFDAGADGKRAEQIMLQSWYGRADPAVGEMVRYDDQVRKEAERLRETLATLTLGGGGQGREVGETSIANALPTAARHQTVSTPPWDVFGRPQRSSVLVFQNDHMEQSE